MLAVALFATLALAALVRSSALQLQEFEELLDRQFRLADDRAKRHGCEFPVQRNDDGQVCLAQLHVTSALTDSRESSVDERVDRICSADDRERRVHAESWNVVTIGWLRSNGSFSSSK